MKRIYIVLALLLLAARLTLHGQLTFQRTMDGFGWDVQATSDGGMVVCGYASLSAPNGNDLFLLKTDANGDTLWARAIGGTGFDTGLAAIQTADGDYLAVGYTYSQAVGASDGFAVMLDDQGHLLWTKSYGGEYADDLVAVQQTFDGGYIMMGSTASFGTGNTDFDVYLIRTDGNGDTLWTRRFGGSGADNGLDLVQSADSGFAIGGYSDSFGAGQNDAFLMKVDAGGNLLWTKAYGGPESDVGSSLVATPDGGYLIAGKTHSFGAFSNDGDLYLIKTDAQGDTLWTRAYGGSGSDWGLAVQETMDGGFAVAGYTYSFGAGNIDAYLVKTDSLGGLRWSKALGGTGFDYAYGLLATADNGYAMVGQTSSFGANGLYFILTDPNGDAGCNTMDVSSIETGCATQVGNPNLYQASTGTVVTLPNSTTAALTDIDYLCYHVGLEGSESLSSRIYPNPAHEFALLEFKNAGHEDCALMVYDRQGSLVQTVTGIKGSQVRVDRNGLASGLYFCRLIKESGETGTMRLVFE